MNPAAVAPAVENRLLEYGVLGVVVLIMFGVVAYLWRTDRADKKAAQGERDGERKEREAMRLSCAKEISDLRLAHEKEKAELHSGYRDQLEEQQTRHYEERAEWQEAHIVRMEAVTREVLVTTKSLEGTLAKALDRLTNK